MAHQYPSMPPFGNGYPPMPYYSPFATNNPTQSLPNTAPGYQQTNNLQANDQTPTPQPSSMHYDHATGAHSHQVAPFPFHPAFNPELLKHFPPPPPPPPPTNFNSGPGTPSAFSQFAQTSNSAAHPYMQQNYLPFAQQQTVATLPPQNQSQFASHGTTAGNTLTPLESQDMGNVFGKSVETQPASLNDHTETTVVSEHGARSVPAPRARGTAARTPHRHDNGSADSSTPYSSTHVSPGPIREQQVQNKQPRSGVAASDPTASIRQPAKLHGPPTDLKENAKAAILSLLPHKIASNELLDEGISPRILQQLYSELGLSWHARDAKVFPNRPQASNQAAAHSESPVQPQLAALPVDDAKNTVAQEATSSLATSQVSLPTSSGIERKDRIAQLLAAKTAKVASTGMASPSASPIPRPEVRKVNPDLNSNPVEASMGLQSAKSIELNNVHPSSERLRQDSSKAAGNGGESISAALAESQLRRGNTSAAAKASYMQPGFSSMIPGLFMAVDEETNSNDFPDSDIVPSTHRSPFDTILPVSERELSATHSAQKRSLNSFHGDDIDEPPAKRAALPAEEPADVEMELDASSSEEASEGEIVEEEHPPQPAVQVRGGTPSLSVNANTIPLPIGHQPNSAKTRAPVESVKQPDFDTSRRWTSENEQRRNLNNYPQSYISSPLSSQPTTPAAVQASQSLSGPPTTQRFQDSDAGQAKAAVPSPRPLSKLTPAQLAERAAQLKADIIRQKAMRQKQLMEGVPALDDEVVQTQQRIQQSRAKLSEIRSLLAKYETDIARARDDEREVMDEIERLEKQLQTGISGYQQITDELKDLKQQGRANELAQSPVPKEPNIHPDRDVPMPGGVVAHTKPQPEQQPVIESHHHTIPSIIDANQSHKASPSPLGESVRSDDQHLQAMSSSISSTLPDATSHQSVISRSLNRAQSAGSPQHETNTSFSAAQDVQSSIVLNHRESEDDQNDHSDGQSEDSRMSIDNDDETSDEDNLDSDGSASMSDSDSDGYEPAEAELGPSQPLTSQIEDSDEYEPEFSAGNDVRGEDIGDEYEPSEHVERLGIETDHPATGSSVTSPVENTPNSSSMVSATTKEDIGSLAVSQNVSSQGTEDREHGLQLSEANTLIKPQEFLKQTGTGNEAPLGVEQPLSIHYVPYQSPLSAFKSYRFHPSFSERVKNGYRSLTYSNKIDPRLPVCPTELLGGVCDDPECQEQHFGSMALTDDKILVQMGSANDIKDKALRDQYLLGLKQVIASLRQEGVKEFSQVADALSKYRRDWSMAQPGL